MIAALIFILYCIIHLSDKVFNQILILWDCALYTIFRKRCYILAGNVNTYDSDPRILITA